MDVQKHENEAWLAQHAPRTWQRMLSGRRLNLINPSPLDIEIGDVALGLSRNARWNGQTTGDYGWSVAQHSVLVTDIVLKLSPRAPTWVQLAALLHDAPEYVTHDLITPLKAVVGPVFKTVETGLQRAVHLAFGLPADLPAEIKTLIKRADRVAGATEAVGLAGFRAEEVGPILGIREAPLDLDLDPLPSKQAEAAFLIHFQRLHRAHSAGGSPPS